MVNPFVEGQLVKVLQRQWPGVNKEGGVARVFKINSDSTVAVAYVLGNEKESSVDVKVSPLSVTAVATVVAAAGTAVCFYRALRCGCRLPDMIPSHLTIIV